MSVDLWAVLTGCSEWSARRPAAGEFPLARVEAHSGRALQSSAQALFRRFILALLLPIVAGCAHQGAAIWKASDIEALPSSPIRLVNQGQTVGYVSREKVRLLIDVKNGIEAVALGVYADLLIASPKEPNAFASFHNGRPVVGITLGMLEMVGWDRSAYAAVIGHEFAHLALHHGQARTQREGVGRTAGAILGVILSQAGVPMGGTVADLAVTAVERSYTRDEEREADKLGFEYLVKAGYDPDGAIRLWEKMERTSPGFSIPFLATHPISQERIESMRTLAASRVPDKQAVASHAVMPEPRSQPGSPSTALATSASAGGEEPAFLTEAQRRIAIGKQVWISMEPLGLYKEPSRESERIERLYKEGILIVEEISGEWVKVRSNNGSRGWIMRSWVGRVQ